MSKIIEHDGRKLQLHAVDLGSEALAYELQVYDQGSVVWVKRFDYRDLADLPRGEFDQALSARMEKGLRTVEVAIRAGRIG